MATKNTTDNPTVSLRLTIGDVQSLCVKAMKDAALTALIFARQTIRRRSPQHKVNSQSVPCGAQDADWENYLALERKYEDSVRLVHSLIGAIETEGFELMVTEMSELYQDSNEIVSLVDDNSIHDRLLMKLVSDYMDRVESRSV